MKYYLLIDGVKEHIVLGETTLGKTFLPDTGWDILQSIFEIKKGDIPKMMIINEKAKKIDIYSFLEMIEKNGIINQKGD